MRRSVIALVALAGLSLGACDPTKLDADVTAAVADFNSKVALLNQDIAVLAKDGLPTVCATATTLDGLFQDAVAIYPAGAASQVPVEQAAFNIVKQTCANPPTDAATLAAAVVALVPQVIAIQNAVKAASAQ